MVQRNCLLRVLSRRRLLQEQREAALSAGCPGLCFHQSLAAGREVEEYFLKIHALMHGESFFQAADAPLAWERAMALQGLVLQEPRGGHRISHVDCRVHSVFWEL